MQTTHVFGIHELAVLGGPDGYSDSCAECRARLNALNICRQSEHYCTA